MSKQKKPFLKRGTRQFLSNAQVRSQSSKPKICEFTDNHYDESPIPSANKLPAKTYDDQYDIAVRNKSPKTRSSSKMQTKSNNYVQKQIKQKQIKVPQIPKSSNKKSPAARKKQTNLQDYLDEEQFINTSVQKKAAKPIKQKQNNIFIKQPTIKNEPNSYSKRNGSLTGFLKQQEQESDQERYNLENNSSFRPIPNPLKNQRSRSPISKSPVNTHSKQRKNIFEKTVLVENKIQHIDPAGQHFNFISDDSEEQQVVYNQKQNRNSNKRNILENQPHDSHVKQKYFCKNKPASNISANNQLPIQNKQTKLTIADIPSELKDQIIRQQIAEKEKELFSQIMKVKEKYQEASRSKQKLQQQHKALTKAKSEFQKQMQQRYAQFEQKMKSENSKLAREKKYMKDAQMASKGDWKLKNQLAEVKKLLEQTKQDRKRVEKKLRSELDYSRKKCQQEILKNKALTEQIRLLEYGKLAQNQQLQQIQKQQKQQKKILLGQTKKNQQWPYAPKQSYLQQLLFSNDFMLNKLKLPNYHYQANQYYKFYLQIRDEESTLQRQEQGEEKVKRIYQSGKIQHEHYNKFIKQIYPFDYNIVHFVNGDVKQELFNRQIMIYYSHNSNATQIKCKNRVITYFHNNGTVQMEFQTKNGTLEEVYNGERLRRTCPDGKIIEERMT